MSKQIKMPDPDIIPDIIILSDIDQLKLEIKQFTAKMNGKAFMKPDELNTFNDLYSRAYHSVVDTRCQDCFIRGYNALKHFIE